jgi:hypothetical protein
MLPRRNALVTLLSLLVLALVPRTTEAGVARAIGLDELVRASDFVALGTPVDSYSLWEDEAGRRRIVTYTRVRVEQSLGRRVSSEPELLVRTLGGHVGKIGQIVHGEPLLAIGQRAALFIRRAADGSVRITARTQGYYPLRPDVHGTPRLAAAPGLSHLIGQQSVSAVRRLTGVTVPDATRLVREAEAP